MTYSEFRKRRGSLTVTVSVLPVLLSRNVTKPVVLSILTMAQQGPAANT